MRCITSPTSRPQCCHRQSQRIDLLAYTNLTRCNKHYQRRHWATSYDHLLWRRLQAPHRQRCLPCSSNSPANHHPLIPRQMLQESLLCLRTQAIIVWQLIVVLGPNFRVSYTPAACPDYRVVTTLQDCIGLLVIIRGISSCWRLLGWHPIRPLSRFSSGGFSSRLIINGKLPDVGSFTPFDKNCESGKISKKMLRMHSKSLELRFWISLRSSMHSVH